MSNATHRKTREVPAGRILAVVALILALSGVLLLVASLTGPTAKAGTAYLIPPVTAAKAVDRGYTGQADRVTRWQQVLRHCKRVGCVSHVPAAMRRDMGIKPGQAYRVHFGDTTFVWVRLPGGRVRTLTS